jgi:hypothetical protein
MAIRAVYEGFTALLAKSHPHDDDDEKLQVWNSIRSMLMLEHCC